MLPEQTPVQTFTRVLEAVVQLLDVETPDIVLVQGDTCTAAAAALAAFYRIPVGHVEAGLRTTNIQSPFPEEMNRRLISVVTKMHFAPTPRAAVALLRAGVPHDRIWVTGNTAIDALLVTAAAPVPAAAREMLLKNGLFNEKRRLLLVTAHRRENFGDPLKQICQALRQIIAGFPQVMIIFPVHLNPEVRRIVFSILSTQPRIVLTEPLAYDVLLHLMRQAHILLTDSGGLQEEAPALGKPVLIMRTESKRPEVIEAGAAKLVGVDAAAIVQAVEELLTNESLYNRMAQPVFPYGKGDAAVKIADCLQAFVPAFQK